MSTSEDREFRGFVRGVVKAEADEVATGGDVPDAEADQRLSAAMVAKYGPRRSRPRWAMAAVGTAAALAGIALFGPWVTPPAPKYVMTLRLDDQILGPDLAASSKLSREGTLSVELRPEQALKARPEIRAFVQSADGYTDCSVVPDCEPQGFCRIRLPVKSLPALPAGKFNLLFVLSSSTLPRREVLLRELAHEPPSCGASCQVLQKTIELVGP